MNPIFALLLVVLLISLLSVYRYFCPEARGGLKSFARHLAFSVSISLAVWMFNLLTGWGPVRELDSVLAGLGVLFTAGLLVGFVSGLILHLDECKAAFAFFWPNQAPSPRLRPRFENEAATPTYFSRKKNLALPRPAKNNRLDWCEECERWHSAQTNHEHNLVG